MFIPPLCTRYSVDIDVIVTTETLCKRIVLNLQLSDLKDMKMKKINEPSTHLSVCVETCGFFPHRVVLVGRDGDKNGLGERVCVERRVAGAKAVLLISLHYVQSWLVFMHRV